MSEMIRRTKLERFVKMLEGEMSDLEGESSAHGMGLYYEGCRKTQEMIINKIKREFKLKEDKCKRMDN